MRAKARETWSLGAVRGWYRKVRKGGRKVRKAGWPDHDVVGGLGQRGKSLRLLCLAGLCSLVLAARSW